MPSSPPLHLFNQLQQGSLSPQQQQQFATQFLAFLQEQHQGQQQPPRTSNPSQTSLSSAQPLNLSAPLPAIIGNHADLPTSSSANPASNESTLPNSNDSDEEFKNSRFGLNKAMGVEPNNRVAVQARRKEVMGYCSEYNETLDKPYREWDPRSWRQLLNAVTVEFHKRHGWSRETCERVMKSICSDTARNRRGQAKRDQLRVQQSGDAAPSNIARPRVARPLTKKPPPLRKPSKKSLEGVLQTPTSASATSSASILPVLEGFSTSGTAGLHSPKSHPASRIAPQESSDEAHHNPHMMQLHIWKAGVVSWDRRQTFDEFSALLNVYLPIKEPDSEVWIGKCDDWKEWKPIVFDSNYLNAMLSTSTYMRMKIVPRTWIGNEDEDYYEDLSVCIPLSLLYDHI